MPWLAVAACAVTLTVQVLTGITSASALIIFFSQLKHVPGLDIPRNKKVQKPLDVSNLHELVCVCA